MKKRLCLLGLAMALVVGGMIGTGCVPQAKYDEMSSTAVRLKTALDKAERLAAARKQKLDALQADLDATRAALKKAGGNMAELKRSRAALRELAKMKAEMRRQKALNAKLRRSFSKMISAGKLKLINRKGRLVIQMRSKVLFASGKAKLTKQGRKAVRRLGRVLRTIKRHFQVAGHTDSIPTRGVGFKDNWALSSTRAMVVVRLLRKSGVRGSRLSAAGFGSYDPVRRNSSRKGRAQNRRIEITLLPSVNVKPVR